MHHTSFSRLSSANGCHPHTNTFLDISTAAVFTLACKANMKKEKTVSSQNSLLREDRSCALAVHCSTPVVLLVAPLSLATSLHLLLLFRHYDIMRDLYEIYFSIQQQYKPYTKHRTFIVRGPCCVSPSIHLTREQRF
jgi:hypothetical protein